MKGREGLKRLAGRPYDATPFQLMAPPEGNSWFILRLAFS